MTYPLLYCPTLFTRQLQSFVQPFRSVYAAFSTLIFSAFSEL